MLRQLHRGAAAARRQRPRELEAVVLRAMAKGADTSGARGGRCPRWFAFAGSTSPRRASWGRRRVRTSTKPARRALDRGWPRQAGPAGRRISCCGAAADPAGCRPDRPYVHRRRSGFRAQPGDGRAGGTGCRARSPESMARDTPRLHRAARVRRAGPAAGDACAALRCFEDVEAACPDASRARALSSRPAARRRAGQREQQVAVHAAAARRALDAREWTTAIGESRQALGLAPGHELALALLAEEEQSIGREQRCIALVTQRLIERASHAIDNLQFDPAEAALKEADSMAPGLAPVRDLRLQLAAARAAAEAAELPLGQLSVDEVRRARSVFRRGRYDEAVQQLRGFLEVEPDAQEVGRELERPIALRESMVTTARVARRKARDCASRATTLAEAGDLAAALDLAREAIRLDPTDADAAATIDLLLARQFEERVAQERNRIREERTRDVEPLLDTRRGAPASAASSRSLCRRLLPHSESCPSVRTLWRSSTRSREELTLEDHETFELTAPTGTLVRLRPARPRCPARPRGREPLSTAAFRTGPTSSGPACGGKA